MGTEDIELMLRNLFNNSCKYCTCPVTNSEACEFCEFDCHVSFRCDLNKIKQDYIVDDNTLNMLSNTLRNKCKACRYFGCRHTNTTNTITSYCKGCVKGDRFQFDSPTLENLTHEIITNILTGEN